MTRMGARWTAVFLVGLGTMTTGWAPEAQAQQEPRVRLTLASQTPTIGKGSPLRVSLRAENLGNRPIEDLTATLWVYNPARSRSEYRQSLSPDSGLFPVFVAPFPIRGSLGPGEGRVIVIERRVPELVARNESALHPVKVQVESSGIPVASLHSAVVFMHERPLIPLNLGIGVVLDEEVLVRSDGALLDDTLPRSIAPGGRLEATVGALEGTEVQLTVGVSPLLLDQLAAMRGGYRLATSRGGLREVKAGDTEARHATGLLDRLGRLARDPRTQVVALPYASPSVATLVHSGLEDTLEAQFVRGRATVESRLGVAPADSILIPPGGEMTPRTLRRLRRLGVRLLLVDAEAVEHPGPGQATRPASASLRAGDLSVSALVPDPPVARLLTPARDQLLRAQRAIGELAAIYFERPGVDRSAAILLGGKEPVDPSVLSAFFTQLEGAASLRRLAWMSPVKASRAAAGQRAPRRHLRAQSVEPFGPRMLEAIARARTAVESLAAVAAEDPPLVDRLRQLLLISESRHFARRETRAVALLDAIRRRVRTEFGKLELPSGTSVTLTSREGLIPITVGSTIEYPIRVRLRLVSPRLRFPEGGPRTLLLDRPQQAFTVPVLAQTTGRFPVRILLETPRGSRIAESRIVVQSTAYNTRALLVVMAAAAFLLGLWGRRFLSRTRS